MGRRTYRAKKMAAAALNELAAVDGRAVEEEVR
jgi:hypothetical protein